jgi:hypothetical protein
MEIFIAMAIRPFLIFILLACICLPARYAVMRWIPQGRIKGWLLREVRWIEKDLTMDEIKKARECDSRYGPAIR